MSSNYVTLSSTLHLTPWGILLDGSGLLNPGRQELLRCVMIGNEPVQGKDLPSLVISNRTEPGHQGFRQKLLL